MGRQTLWWRCQAGKLVNGRQGQVNVGRHHAWHDFFAGESRALVFGVAGRRYALFKLMHWFYYVLISNVNSCVDNMWEICVNLQQLCTEYLFYRSISY